MKQKVKFWLAHILYRIMHFDAFVTLTSKHRDYSAGDFKGFGTNSQLPQVLIIKNPGYITIGDNFSSLYNLRIEAWDEYRGDKFDPEIIIGDNVIMNTDCHIGCINKIVIGNNVLMASRVYISDHSHGRINAQELNIIPTRRKLFSKGPVIIGDNVWVGEGVCIMPGVTIGANSIIGANAVVTKDIPPNVVVAGIPAVIIKKLEA
jgi:acetyltransferase-like isoleucine patch superfamily enzyme